LGGDFRGVDRGDGDGGGGGHDALERVDLVLDGRDGEAANGVVVGALGGLFVDGFWDGFQAPDETGVGEKFQAVVGDVDFPPIKAVASGALVAVVVVVPAFAERDEGENETVAGIVGGIKAAVAPEVREGIDRSRAVEEGGGADEESPDEKLRAVGLKRRRGVGEEVAEREEADREQYGNDDIKTTEPDNLGIFGEVLDLGIIGGEIAFARDPADVRPEKTVDAGRVGVDGLVGVLVMVAMVGGPPKRAALDSGSRPEGEEELAEAGSAVGFVGKIAVQNSGDGEHADDVEGERHPDDEPAPADPDHAQATEMEDDKWNAAHEIDAIGLGANDLG